MRNINVQLTIDRHASNGNAYLRGRMGEHDVSLSVQRGASDGAARVQGDWGDRDSVDLVFDRRANDGYTGFRGTLRGKQVDATLRKEVGGDSTTSMSGTRYEVDRDQRGERVVLRGSDVDGRFDRDLAEGDERGSVTVEDQYVRFAVDRDPRSGDFEISGRSSDGSYRLEVSREQFDGDLTLSGSLPEDAELFPLFWEILGDDKNIPDRNPYYPSSLLGMSMYVDHEQDQGSRLPR